MNVASGNFPARLGTGKRLPELMKKLDKPPAPKESRPKEGKKEAPKAKTDALPDKK